VDKFSCKNCGACCTKFSVIGALPFFEWEVEGIIEEAKILGVSLDIRPINLMFDEISGIYFFPQYGMFNEPCPFHVPGKCLIHSKRPYVCRMFPLIKTPSIDGTEVDFGWFSYCPNFDMPKLVEETNYEKLNQKILNKKFQESFGECNEVCFKATNVRNKLDFIVRELIDKGKIRLRGLNENEEIKNPLPIIDFLVKIKAISLEEKSKIIEDFKK